MDIDLAYRIELTPLSPRKYLYPLFEAIANSIQAIQEAKEPNGEIIINVMRDTSQPGLSTEEETIKPAQPIVGFAVEDNGIGFTDENFQSFDKVHSPKKRRLGGKGVGRLLWLKAFRKAEIDSTYQDGDEVKRRTFEFSIPQNGVGGEQFAELNGSGKRRRTVVKLLDYLPAYAEKCTANTELLARKIIAHFISSFILGSGPTIIIKDDSEDTVINLSTEFRQKMRLDCTTKKLRIRSHQFKLEHLRLAAASHSKHEMLLCSQGRVVETEDLQNHIPSLRGPLHAGEQPFFYSVVVHGKYFEGEYVDWERTKLAIADLKELDFGDDELTRQEIHKKVAEASDKFLKSYLEPLRGKNTQRIVDYIQKHEPKYRPLAKHRPHWFDRIAPNIPFDSLSVELYKLNREYEAQTRNELARVKRKVDSPEKAAAHKEKFNQYLTEINDQAIASLADYVVHRRAVLDFLEESIRQLPAGAYVAEKYIHQIICPLGTTTDTVHLDQMNLWIIDERLNFHYYMSSDRKQKAVAPLKGTSENRADIILFNHALAFADQAFGSIVILEFKRPMRDDYSEAENPISQVFRYVEEIRSGDMKTKSGRPVPSDTPMYAYIVCDVTPNLKKFARTFDFTPLHDLDGYCRYHSDYKLYVEVLSFDKLLKDAKQRNASFFDKLRLPMTDIGH